MWSGFLPGENKSEPTAEAASSNRPVKETTANWRGTDKVKGTAGKYNKTWDRKGVGKFQWF